MGQPFVPILIPARADPRVKALYELMNEHLMPRARLARHAGVSVRAVKTWDHRSPTLGNIEACLNVMGKTLVVADLPPRPVRRLHRKLP